MTIRGLFCIDAAVTRRFPGIKSGLALIRNVAVVRSNPALRNFKKRLIAQIEADLRGKALSSLPRVQCFRRIYRGFGVDPGSRRPSAEALMRRIARGSGLYSINSVVDTYNVMSAFHQLPMAAYDFDELTCPVELRFSREGEFHIPIGQVQPDALRADELVYADQDKVVCRDFNYRDSDMTKVTAATTDILLFVDGCEVVEAAELERVTTSVAERIVEFSGGHVEIVRVYY